MAGRTWVQYLVVSENDGNRRIELPKATFHPIMSLLLIFPSDARRGKQLFDNIDLSAPMFPFIGTMRKAFTLWRLIREHFFDITASYFIEDGARLVSSMISHPTD
jgi:hypothetical protein